MADHNRVLILGLDGVPWSLLDPWLAEGKLPNLARLIANGVRGDLRSTIPYVTSPAWTSCVTGVNPGKHGILDFAVRRPHSYAVDIVNSTRVRAKPLWTRLSEAGRRVGVVNVPVTYPPQPVNGVMVTCMLTPSLASRFTYPDALREELLAAVPAYAIEPVEPSSDTARTKAELARNLGPTVEARAQATRWLMDRLGDWDFFMTVFTEPDRLMTYGWDDFDPRHPRHNPASARLYGGLFLQHYQHLDNVVGQFVDAWADKATILVISDHGLAGVQRFIYPNVWLHRNGYLALKPEARPTALGVARKAARRLGVAHQAKKLAKRFFPDWGFTTEERSASFLHRVDWSTTCVYWGADNGLTINLKGRQPEGIVEPAEYGALCDELIARWRDLRCPENGDPVVEAIYRREDIFSGPHAADSPDLLVVWKSDSDRRTTYFSAGELWADAMFSSAGPTGAHVPVGVLIAGGRHIVPGGSIEGAHIMDIAPTVLHALSQPIPQGMDGKVLDGIFDPALRPAPHAAVDAARSPAPSAEDQGTETTHGVESEPQATYSPDEQKQIEERLRALGYLD